MLLDLISKTTSGEDSIPQSSPLYSLIHSPATSTGLGQSILPGEVKLLK
jgi:hypothetical protein